MYAEFTELMAVRVLNVPEGAETTVATKELTLRLLTEPSCAPTNAEVSELMAVRVLNVPEGAEMAVATRVLAVRLLTEPNWLVIVLDCIVFAINELIASVLAAPFLIVRLSAMNELILTSLSKNSTSDTISELIFMLLADPTRIEMTSAMNELRVTSLSINSRSDTMSELMVIEEAEPF
jgi:hypothetical protein